MALPVAADKGFGKTRQIYWGLLVFVFYYLLILRLADYNREAFLTALFGFAFGYILQRSRFCFAAGFRDIFMIRNTIVTRAILLLLLLTSIGFILVNQMGGSDISAGGIIYPVGLHTVIGGVIFGFGLVIAGNCVSGCLMRMGEGYLMQWFTFIGLMVGSALGAWNLGWWGPQVIEHSPQVFIPDHLGWFTTITVYIAVIAVIYCLLLWYERGTIKGALSLSFSGASLHSSIKLMGQMLFAGRNWSYILGAVALSLTNILTFYFWGRPGAITGGLTHLAGWLSCRVGFLPCDWYYFNKLIYLESRHIFLEHPLLYMSAGIVLGSFFASLLHREFRIRQPKSYKFVISALIGGTLLGYSSRVAMGCNFGGFWGGVSSFSLHGWVFGIFIFLGAYLGGKFFMRYLV